ncbi:MAG: helix-hairpin-helix domain-containing protein [Desulfitobacteriaceae bacterium]|nr:helix-hairpin-helix domain-containing protein [Desulfitobacteriaceae bacterium]MDI6880883.1 helix-hairpin-helix domain-containing protein [Desulfitobacteriaceae bacterium]MDI6915978.1 helix-hairpin-helix domain-containing protein [Desulfitobacteriaceae bacterium]
MERRFRFIWWGLLVVLIIVASWRLFLPHGNKAYLEKTSTSREIIVYVTGAVSKPELVHLSLDARLDDALKKVSLLPEANLEALNPAEKLKDGQKIAIPYKPVVAVTTAGSPISPGSSGSASTAATAGSTAATASSGSAATASSGGSKININTAGVAELDKLPGIGPALAERIVQYRTDNGPFVRPEDLQEVAGIGPKTYEKMASMVSVGP